MTTIKNIRLAFAATSFVLLCAGCNYLDIVPDDTVTEESKWVDSKTAERTLATVYKCLPPMGDYNGNPGFFGAGEIILPENSQWIEQNCMRIFNRTNGPSVNPFDYWQGEWGGPSAMRQCNDFLDGIDRVNNMDKKEKERMKAEVKIIKAYVIFYMVRQYGPICPLRTNPSIEQGTSENRVYREPIDDTFRYAVSLLDEAIEGGALPTIITNRTEELGRFTLPAAKFLKARILLYWASPLFNGNTDYAGFLAPDGTPYFNQTEDPTRWQLAAEACEDALECCAEGGIKLYDASEYRTRANLCPQTLLVNVLRSAVSEVWNCELIWGNTANPVTSSMYGQAFSILGAGENGWKCEHSFGVPIGIANRFYTKNGLPIEHDAQYPSANLYQLYKYENGGSFPETFDYDYNRHYIVMDSYQPGMNFDREPRFYSSLGFNRGVWYGNFYNDPVDDATIEITSGTYASPKSYYGEFSSVANTYYYNPTGYWPKKLVSLTVTQSATDNIAWGTSYPYPDMRFSDLLLMAAEAWNEVEGPTPKVIQYVDQVRKRAGLEGLAEAYNKYAKNQYRNYYQTKTQMRQIILREREVEFAFEGKTYWDELRRMTAETHLNRAVLGWNVMGNSDSDAEIDKAREYYISNPIYIQGFSHRDYFFPIPDNEIQKNPNLGQNPGW